jgi:hypothetical protein
MRIDKETSTIKVIDFGMAELFPRGQDFAKQIGGTLLYMAPEVFRSELGFKCDVWSCGVILYYLAARGNYPFLATWPPPPGKNEDWWQQETMSIITYSEPAPNQYLMSMSPELQDLVRLMLAKDPSMRPDAAECLNHPWFAKFHGAPQSLSVGISQTLEAYSRESELKKAIFLLMAHQCSMPALHELRAIFTHFDHSNLGVLAAQDLGELLMRSGFDGGQCNRILTALDRDSDGAVSWTEFLAAALCQRLANDGRLIDAAFATFSDHDEELHQADFERILAQGAQRDAWKKALPTEIAAMKRHDKKEDKRMIVKLKQLFDGCVATSTSRTVTKDDFREYVGRKLQVNTGEKLFRVS